MNLKNKMKQFLKLSEEIKLGLQKKERPNREELQMLCELFQEKVHHFLIFDILIVHFPEVAIDLLHDTYLSPYLRLIESPKDHVEDLDLLFDSVVECFGKEKLRKILTSERASIINVNYYRTLRAVQFAYDLEGDEYPSWIPVTRDRKIVNSGFFEEILAKSKDDRLFIQKTCEEFFRAYKENVLDFDSAKSEELFHEIMPVLEGFNFKTENGEWLYSPNDLEGLLS